MSRLLLVSFLAVTLTGMPGCDGSSEREGELPDASAGTNSAQAGAAHEASLRPADDGADLAHAPPDPFTPAPGSTESVLAEIESLRFIRPAGQSPEELAALMNHRNRRIVELSGQLLAASDDPSVRMRATEARLHALLELSVGDTRALEELYALADEIIAADPASRAALDAAYYRLRAAQTQADLTQSVSTRWVEAFAEEAQAFAGRYGTQAETRALQSLVHAGHLADQHGLVPQAVACFRLVAELFPESSYTPMVQGIVRRLTLPGNEIDLTGPTLDGGTYAIQSQRGNVVLVVFWATWCGPCIEEMPELLDIYRRYRDRGFEIVGVNLDENPDEAQAFLTQNPLPWPQIVSENGANQVAEDYGIIMIPAAFLVDRNGRVLSTRIEPGGIEDAVAAALTGAAQRE